MQIRSLLAFVVLVASAAIAQDPRPAKHDPNLTAIDWLTKGTWVARVTSPDGKVTTLIEQRLAWVETGTAIRFQTNFNGSPQYFGFYAYDPSRKQIRFFYSSAQGDLSEGYATVQKDGLEQHFSVADGKSTAQYRGSIVREGDDAYVFNVYPEGGQTAVITVRYVRVASAV